MMKFPHDSIKPFEAQGSKKEQVIAMFDNIAIRYDFMNRLLSGGIDKIWRKKAISRFKEDKPRFMLDVATGTGDMAILASKILKPEKIIGIDISEKMLSEGRKKIEKYKSDTIIELQPGDAETINFNNNTFDAVMVAFGVRNFEQLEKGLKEIYRVLKPGALLVVLEFSRPRNSIFRLFYKIYMSFLAPQMASWFNQSKKAYEYLNESAMAFPEREDFVEILKKTGYSDTRWKQLSLGICCMYSGRK